MDCLLCGQINCPRPTSHTYQSIFYSKTNTGAHTGPSLPHWLPHHTPHHTPLTPHPSLPHPSHPHSTPLTHTHTPHPSLHTTHIVLESGCPPLLHTYHRRKIAHGWFKFNKLLPNLTVCMWAGGCVKIKSLFWACFRQNKNGKLWHFPSWDLSMPSERAPSKSFHKKSLELGHQNMSYGCSKTTRHCDQYGMTNQF